MAQVVGNHPTKLKVASRFLTKAHASVEGTILVEVTFLPVPPPIPSKKQKQQPMVDGISTQYPVPPRPTAHPDFSCHGLGKGLDMGADTDLHLQFPLPENDCSAFRPSFLIVFYLFRMLIFKLNEIKDVCQ